MRFLVCIFSITVFSAVGANPLTDHLIRSEIYPSNDDSSSVDLEIRQASNPQERDLDPSNQGQIVSSQDEEAVPIAADSDSVGSTALRFDDPPCPPDSVSKRGRRSCLEAPVQTTPQPEEDPSKPQLPFTIPSTLPNINQLGQLLREKGEFLGGESCRDPFYPEHLCCDWPESDKLGIPPHEYFRSFENCDICKFRPDILPLGLSLNCV